MCGRFTITTAIDDIMEHFAISNEIDDAYYQPSFNVAPSQNVLSVINDGENNRLGYLHWGLIPPWAKDKKIGYKMINARAETLTVKPSYRNAYKKRRCIIVADSFYEWKRLDDKTKIPMRVKLKSNELFGMAGLWESWKTNNETIHSCTIITTKPNELVAEIHDRMPVILKQQNEQTWLDPSITDTNQLSPLLVPYDASDMEAYQVTPLVNSPKNNSVDLIQRV
ncbi:SOS response-associated peptidase [Sporosarcina sp. ACRSM]|uniref:SOS response-associated peptidase n=1 Tax=Sporosarcina sp. ACRSM TaxID=2918216 RepID=UPI001EF3DB79|nr:SOS response-associated peptidase [Sporosarcina sp. ACRSM]MCG7337169.1 SOS response-associated peptidase [Sporosarcina sp. ACRSM]